MSGGRASRRKGDAIERALVAAHKALGVSAERVPLSGASHYQGNGADMDLLINGRVWKAEAKARKNGEGFRVIEEWLGDNDVLFLKRNRNPPLVVLPFAQWAELVSKKGATESE